MVEFPTWRCPVIAIRNLTKRYGSVTAVDDLSFDVVAGRVTGFLGPNGAGKSTTMRVLIGLDHATRGTALIGGRAYRELRAPVRQVGALLDARAVHPGRSARAHLVAMAHSSRITRKRVDEVLGLVGLSDVAGRRAGTFSLGMSQRLGIAGALLGDPEVLLFDEPVNGLDPDGIRWIRDLLRSLAAEGRTVLVSSHLMSEMQLTADRLIIVGRGRLLADASMDELIDGNSRNAITVRSPDRPRLDQLRLDLVAAEHQVAEITAEELRVVGTDIEQVADRAFELGLRVHELSHQRSSLEQTYMDLTTGSVEYGVRDDPEAGEGPATSSPAMGAPATADR